MSSTESSGGFFSKLFGRSVSRPASSSTSSSDSLPSSSSNGGFLSSQDEYPNTNGSSPATSKPLRYLSPTAIESSFSRVPNRTVESTSDAGRKRPLESPQATSGITNGSFYISDTAKRFRGSAANTSLISEPVTRLDLQIPRLDTTWSAGMGALSPTNLSYSPCSSVRSLRSRITRPSSRSSVLSSKTAALLGQIEKVSTPALDARRMPMLRVGLNKERWNSLGSTTSTNPPLIRLSTAPSRYQVMSSFLTPMQKKPYWRDVARERTEEPNEVTRIPSEQSSSNAIVVRVENGEKNGAKEHPMRSSNHQPVLKGPDGLNVNRDRNTFSANDISHDDSVDLEVLNNVRGLDVSQFVFALPTKGFLAKDVKPSFSFKKPVKIAESIAESESSEESESDESNSSGSDSGSGGDDDSENEREKGNNAKTKSEKTSDTSSSAENTSKETSKDENKKNSPPRTTANPIIPTFVPKPTAAAVESPKGGIATTSKPLSTSTSSSTNWNCSTCYVGNKDVDAKCACCGEMKPGSVAPASSSANVFGSNAFKPSASAAPSSSSSSVNWDCPTCCVSNKATDVKCACCGETKPGAVAPPASSSNVFGDRAFKPANSASSGAFSFGLPTGIGNSSAPSFGIKPPTGNEESKSTTSAVTFGIKPTESSAPSIPTIAVSQPLSVVPTATKPLFGAPTSTVSASTGLSGTTFSFGLNTLATNAENGKTVTPTPSTTSPPMSLFTSSASSASSTTPAPLFGLAPSSSSLPPSSAAPPSLPSLPSLPSASLFGSSTPSIPSTLPSSSLFGVPSSGSTLPLFGSSASTSTSTSTSTSNAIPVSSTSLFGAPSTTTPSIPLFGSASSTLAPNGSGSTSTPLSFNFGQSGATKPPLFGASTDKPLFGGSKPSDDEGPGAKKAMFAPSTATSTPFSFGGQNNASGTANLFGSSSSGGSTNPFGSLTQSASAPSFSLPTAPPSTFNFGSQSISSGPPPSTFNFGGPSVPSAPSSTPFVFGSQPTPAAAPSFGLGSFGGGAPPALAVPSFAPPDASNPFAFNSSAPSGSRKMIQAKRRLPGKR